MSSSSTKKNITSIKDIKKRDYKTPKCQWDPKIEAEIQKYIRSALSKSNVNIFENISDCFQTFYDRSCNNMTQLKKRTKNESGFIWEHFCLMYLRAKGYGECWLLAETPVEILEKLNMSRVDMGIDIIIKHQNGFFAVQAKWRSNKRKTSKISLTWNKLATFYALCARTGPWLKFIVITNCDYVRRQGKKYKMDQTIAKGSFLSCKRDAWIKMASMEEGKKVSDPPVSDLVSLVCAVTGRDPKFYKDWEETSLQQRIDYFEEYEQDNDEQDNDEQDNPQPLTLREKQRLQRSSFLNKLFPR